MTVEPLKQRVFLLDRAISTAQRNGLAAAERHVFHGWSNLPTNVATQHPQTVLINAESGGVVLPGSRLFTTASVANNVAKQSTADICHDAHVIMFHLTKSASKIVEQLILNSDTSYEEYNSKVISLAMENITRATDEFVEIRPRIDHEIGGNYDGNPWLLPASRPRPPNLPPRKLYTDFIIPSLPPSEILTPSKFLPLSGKMLMENGIVTTCGYYVRNDIMNMLRNNIKDIRHFAVIRVL